MQKEEAIKGKIAHWQKEQEPWKKTSLLYSWIRLFCIVLAVTVAIYADQTGKQFGFLIAGMSLLLFLVLVIRHNQIKQKLRRQKAKITVGEKLLKRIDGTWTKEAVQSICEKEDTVSYDLDLLGAQSLFDYLNVCATPFGKTFLTSWLKGEDDARASVIKRQNAVKELLHKEEFLWDYESRSILFQEDCMKIKEEDLLFLIAYSRAKNTAFPKPVRILSSLMVIMTWIMLLLGILHVLPYGYAAILMLANLVLSLLFSSISSPALSFTKNLERILKDYNEMFSAVDDQIFDDELLQELQSKMKDAKKGLRHLNQVMDVIAFRHNFLSYILTAIFFQIDVPCVSLLERWRRQYGTHMEEWLMAAGCLEALASLCVMGQTKEETCFPTILEETRPVLNIHEAKHPLLLERQAVANTISLNNGSYIITGSNMSGKTTFLRTLGVSMMLCRAGACVCAKAMETVLLDVHTSMRVKDDVSEGISTFYAELLRIRHMMDAAKRQRPMLVLIDEIFKGTNSADRILCAKTAIASLHQPWIITLVSTHDFELCALSEDEHIKAVNYHFAEYYEADEIKFDYRLKEGRCTSTNAKELMRLAGIITRKEEQYEH